MHEDSFEVLQNSIKRVWKEHKCQQMLAFLHQRKKDRLALMEIIFQKVLLFSPHQQRHACNLIFSISMGVAGFSHGILFLIFISTGSFAPQQGTMWGNVLTHGGLVTIPSLNRVVWTSKVTRDKLCSQLLLDVGVDASVLYLISQMGILLFSQMLCFCS